MRLNKLRKHMKILNWESDVFPYSTRVEAYPEVLEVCFRSLIKERHVEASSVL